MQKPKYYCFKCKRLHFVDSPIGIQHKNLLPATKTKQLQYFEKYEDDEYYYFDNILNDLEDKLGPSYKDKWWDSIEQLTNTIFDDDNYWIVTKSGVMGSKGIVGESTHAKLNFVKKTNKEKNFRQIALEQARKTAHTYNPSLDEIRYKMQKLMTTYGVFDNLKWY